MILASCRTCLFCEGNRFHLNRELSLPAEDSIFYEDEYIYIAPDLFPLCFGHMLITTKEHSNSVGGVSAKVNVSFEKAKDFLISKVYKSNTVTFFEHGAVAIHKGGSCIDHTHVHAIPQVFDLKPKIEASEWVTSIPILGSFANLQNFFDKETPYIHFQEECNLPVAYEVDTLPSQFLRMIIAKELGIDYNWKNDYRRRLKRQLFLDTLELGRNAIAA